MPPLRVLPALLAACLLLPGSAAAAPSSSLLFVQQADGGTLRQTGASTYRLTLRGVGPSVASFEDRPGRSAGSERAGAFVARWRGRGFASDPPNAALVVDGAPRSRDVAMLTLSRPRYDAAARTFTYVARPLQGRPGGALQALAPRRDGLREQRFGAASLFIDDGAAVVYEQLTLQVSNAAPGQRVSVQLRPSGGDAGFSTGPPFQNSSGLQAAAQSGVLPLSQLTMNPSQLTFLTSWQGGASGILSFSVALSLVADPDVEAFFLRSSSDPGVQVTAQIGDAVPQVVNLTDTLFAWDPD